VGTDPFFVAQQREAIVTWAGRAKIPTIYPFREYAAVGGLMSYGANIANSYRQAGIYAGKILKGLPPRSSP
jgi:putative ABC transport system substrate-binding protein